MLGPSRALISSVILLLLFFSSLYSALLLEGSTMDSSSSYQDDSSDLARATILEGFAAIDQQLVGSYVSFSYSSSRITDFSIMFDAGWLSVMDLSFISGPFLADPVANGTRFEGVLTGGPLQISDAPSAPVLHSALSSSSVVDAAPRYGSEFLNLSELVASGLLSSDLATMVQVRAGTWQALFLTNPQFVGIYATSSGSVTRLADGTARATVSAGARLVFQVLVTLTPSSVPSPPVDDTPGDSVDIVNGVINGDIAAQISITSQMGKTRNSSITYEPYLSVDLEDIGETGVIIRVHSTDPSRGGVIAVSIAMEVLGGKSVSIKSTVNSATPRSIADLSQLLSQEWGEPMLYQSVANESANLILYVPTFEGASICISGVIAPAGIGGGDLFWTTLCISFVGVVAGAAVVASARRDSEEQYADLEGIVIDDEEVE